MVIPEKDLHHADYGSIIVGPHDAGREFPAGEIGFDEHRLTELMHQFCA